MQAYQYDRAGLFAGTTEADESPLEPGVYLLPAMCTLEPPPATLPEGKWPRWNGRAWALVGKPAAPAQAQAEPEQEKPDTSPAGTVARLQQLLDDKPTVAKLKKFLDQNPDAALLLGTLIG